MFKKLNSRMNHFKWKKYHLIFRVCLAFIWVLLIGCSSTNWRNQGDSCIHTSEEPPLRRVINYSDHDLCGRKLPPRTPPNPRTRIQTEMEK